MGVYRVKYFNRLSQTIEERIVNANSEEEIIKDALRSTDIVLIDIQRRSKILTFLRGLFTDRVSLKELADFTYTMGKSLEIGIDLLSTLHDLEETTKSKKLKEAVRKIIADVEGGASISEALEKQKNVFPPTFIALVKIGESSGNLANVLLRYAEYLDWLIKLKTEVKKALAYPSMVAIAVSITMIVLITYVLPQITEVIKDLGIKEYPIPTQILIWISEKSKYLPILIILIILSVILLIILRAVSERVRYFTDELILKIPIIGEIVFKKHIVEDLRAMADIHASGGSLLYALELIENDLETNLYLKEVFGKIRESVERGSSLTEAFKNTGAFPPIVVRTIKIGEETGALDDAIMRTVEYYENELRKTLETLTTFIEPALQIILGIMLGLIAAGILFPVYEIVTKLGTR